MLDKLLVTGGDGYIGRNLIDFLSGNNLVKRCESVDIKSGKEVLNINNIWKYDAVVHLAAMAGIAECKNNVEDAVVNNVISTNYIMEQAQKYDVPLVFASSGAAPTPFANFYGMTKFMGEVQAKRLNNKGAKIHVFRFSNVYGGKYWEKKPSVIPLFLNAKKAGKQLIVNGDGSQRRDFIHVLDICKAIWAAVSTERYNIVNLPVPICNGKQTSVLEIAKIIGGENGYQFNPDSKDVGVQDVKSEPFLAMTVYDFKADIDIKEGIYM
jgi:UDP-glucose 4-epimerase